MSKKDSGIELIMKLQEFEVIPKDDEYKYLMGYIMVLRKDEMSFKWRCNANISLLTQKKSILTATKLKCFNSTKNPIYLSHKFANL